MNKQRAAQLYELADRLSKLDVKSLSEQQRQQRSTMIAKLQEEVKTIKEFSPSSDDDHTENEDLYNYAKLWYNGDMSTQEDVEKALDLIGWEIGEVETEEGGAFIIKSGDETGNTYTSFTPEDLSDSDNMSEEFNGEYDDEAGMVQSNLRTMARAVNGLLDTIQDNDNLPEWAQEKLAKAEMMTTSVWDYLLSQKEQGMDPKVQGVAEGYDPAESDYQQWEDILVKDGYRGDPSGAYALELVVGHQLISDPAEVASTIRNILTYVKQNRQVLGKAVSDRKTVKDAIIDIKNKFPQQYRAAQQPQGVSEAKLPEVDSLVTDTEAVMKKFKIDATQALKTVLGEREYNDRPGFYNSFIRQIIARSKQQGIAETKKPSPKLTPVNIKKSDAVSEEINKEAYERLQKVFAFKNYES